jgi:hypothetical protein
MLGLSNGVKPFIPNAKVQMSNEYQIPNSIKIFLDIWAWDLI